MSRVSQNTKRLVFSSVICALGVAILLIGSIVDVLELSVAIIASVLCVMVIIEAKGFWPWLCYGATSILSILLLPYKMPAVLYILVGYYPIVKQKLERLPVIVSWILKFVFFNVSLTLLIAVCRVFFPGVDFALLPWISGAWIYISLFAVGNIVFFIYDLALSRIITFYILKFRDKFKFKI